jgi:2-polyprenyl-3-methyl-5-hydroxy-6-metoxy-1,4-benzoquinol methylase
MAPESMENMKRNRERIRNKIESAKSRLHTKLVRLDPGSLGISEYNQRYLGTKIHYAEATMELYGELIFLALENSSVPMEDCVLVDYGGGSGLITLLALETGIGTVIYNDVYEVSCEDVQKLSKELGLRLEHIVPGDVQDLVAKLREESIAVNAIISNDVLEHIYDVGSHFRLLASTADYPLRVVYATGANIKNRMYVREAVKKQIEVELKNREASWGHKDRDTLRAYLEVRRDLISAYAPALPLAQVEELARATRGLMKQDIENCVDEYRDKGLISYQPKHPTNTCDPNTGNWCEHLMEFDWLENVVEDAGFSVSIFPGTYFMSGSWLKRTAKMLINAALRIFGKRLMFLAPYFVLIAETPVNGKET